MAEHFLRLGVNVDHVATLRNARGGVHPDPVAAARLAVTAGADGITAHLREDRRHITDADMEALREELDVPLNMEMAPTDEMTEIALALLPHAACLVPERREELTTEGGLNVLAGGNHLADVIGRLDDAGIRVSLFIDPDRAQLDAAKHVGAPVVELHTGAYAHAEGVAIEAELNRLRDAARYGAQIGLEVHAGHGLTFDNVGAIAAIPQLQELNIGHFLVGEAITLGLAAAIKEMRRCMNAARAVIREKDAVR